MKRRTWLALLLAVVLAMGLLSGCGASGGEMEAPETEASDDAMNGNGFSPMEDLAPESQKPALEPGETPPSQTAKLIYRGSLELETTEFDQARERLEALVTDCGGYLQSSNLYNYGDGYRSMDCTVRIPKENYRRFYDSAGQLCHVLWQNEETENITQVYYDTSGRLKTQQTKLARLQELLARAESMEDVITIESAIAETEYEIDRLSGELRHYDDLVGYSTVTVSLREVYKLSNTDEPADGFGDRLGKAFATGLRNFGNGLEDFAVFLAYNWLWMVVLAAVIAAAVHIRRRLRREAGEERKPLFRKKKDKEDPKP